MEYLEPIDVKSRIRGTLGCIKMDRTYICLRRVAFRWHRGFESLGVPVTGDDNECLISNGAIIDGGNEIGLVTVTSDDKRMLVSRSELMLLLSNDEVAFEMKEVELAESTVSLVNLVPKDLVLPLSLLQCRATPRPRDFGGTLLFGGKGSGKTYTALFLSAVARLLHGDAVHYWDCRRERDDKAKMQNILRSLDELFDVASKSSSSVIILDNLDELFSCSESAGSQSSGSSQGQQQVHPSAVLQSNLIKAHIERLLAQHAETISFIWTSSSENIEIVAAKPTRPRHIALPCLGGKEKERLFCQLVHQSTSNQLGREVMPRDLDRYRPLDIKRLATRIERRLRVVCANNPRDLIKEETANYIALSCSANDAAGVSENQNWDDIGGSFEAKEALLSTVLRPSLYRRIYERSEMKMARGILLYGQPGCGKTFIVPALARKCRMPLITCRGPELLDRYIGASEAKVRDLFSRAASAAPSILFFDEIDSLAPRRGSDQSGVTDRIVNQLLTFLDGVEDTARGGQVYIIASSSRPDRIDPALLRPGRLEKHVYLGVSTDLDEQEDLFVRLCRSFSFDAEVSELLLQRKLHRELLVDHECSRFLTPADISAAFGAAQLSAVTESIALGRDEHVSLSLSHLQKAFRDAKPALSLPESQALEQVYQSFRGDNACVDAVSSETLMMTALK